MRTGQRPTWTAPDLGAAQCRRALPRMGTPVSGLPDRPAWPCNPVHSGRRHRLWQLWLRVQPSAGATWRPSRLVPAQGHAPTRVQRSSPQQLALAWPGAVPTSGATGDSVVIDISPAQPLKLDPHRGDVDDEEVCEAVDGRLEEAGLRHHPEHWGGSFRSTCAACSSSLSPRRPSPGAQVDTRGDRQHRVDMASTNGVACEEDRAHCNPWKGGALVLTRRWPSSSAGTAP